MEICAIGHLQYGGSKRINAVQTIFSKNAQLASLLIGLQM
jgi:hypothetical protein